MNPIIIKAAWDDQARVWTASSDDVPGLVAEAATIVQLEAQARAALEDLVELDGGDAGRPIEILIVQLDD